MIILTCFFYPDPFHLVKRKRDKRKEVSSNVSFGLALNYRLFSLWIILFPPLALRDIIS